MRIASAWILFTIFPVVLVKTQPVHSEIPPRTYDTDDQKINTAQLIPKLENKSEEEGRVISVRITSSVAVGRGTPDAKSSYGNLETNRQTTVQPITTASADITPSFSTATNSESITTTLQATEALTDIPPHLAGANVEFLKQLQAKKETQALLASERAYQSLPTSYDHLNDTEEGSLLQDSINNVNENHELIEDVPIARSIPLSYSSKSFVHRQGPNSEKLTTVSFNIVHDSPNLYNEQSSTSDYKNHAVETLQKFYNEPSKLYSEQAQIYSEPAKFYSEPAKVYSEPAKIYSEPAKVYSEPAKIYSEPAKFYSKPASLNLSPEAIPTNRNAWLSSTGSTAYTNTYSTTPSQQIRSYSIKGKSDNLTEKNYEVDEKVSVMTDGQSHGEQPNNPENCKQENCKVGYVVEGRQFRKYRVEERTSDGFLVGEYGVVRNEDGALRGVRYTADSEASPRLIHDALMKFLQLK